jgi:hypothetical protein
MLAWTVPRAVRKGAVAAKEGSRPSCRCRRLRHGQGAGSGGRHPSSGAAEIPVRDPLCHPRVEGDRGPCHLCWKGDNLPGSASGWREDPQPGLLVEVPIGGRYASDLVALDPDGRPLPWGECGHDGRGVAPGKARRGALGTARLQPTSTCVRCASFGTLWSLCKRAHRQERRRSKARLCLWELDVWGKSPHSSDSAARQLAPARLHAEMVSASHRVLRPGGGEQARSSRTKAVRRPRRRFLDWTVPEKSRQTIQYGSSRLF